MILANLRAQGWKWAAIVCAALAVAAVVLWAFSGWRAAASDARADAAEARAAELEQDIKEMWAAIEAADVSSEATQTARKGAEQRQAKRDTDMQRVEGYARDAGNVCVGSADILRESQAREGDIRSAEDRLRHRGRATGQDSDPAKPD